jgi:hypothetical protein
MSLVRADNIQPFSSGAAISFGLVSFPSGVSGALNSATLENQPGSYYLNAANLTGTIQASGSFTGTLSGTASNADFLDNLDSSYFRNGANLTGTINATQLNSQTAAYYLNYANITGTIQASGSFTGTLTGTASNADLLDNLDSVYFRNAANLTGTASLSGTFSGLFKADASTTGTASINVPHGTAPTSPLDGDIWTTVSGLYARISGVSVGPYSTGGGGGADEFARTIALLGL